MSSPPISRFQTNTSFIAVQISSRKLLFWDARMVRAPCCEKMGLKKGPWTPEEDQILVKYIQLYGHGNWRALPKQAGLLRCGKSCRLRWINYLRPDIKRGNFSREEEEIIINLHEKLGNRWSAIAARLPGRTDNEIKNVWHTHLKKRLQGQNHATNQDSKRHNPRNSQPTSKHLKTEADQSVNYYYCFPTDDIMKSETKSPDSHWSTSQISSNNDQADFPENLLPEPDEKFWSEFLCNSDGNFPEFDAERSQLQVPLHTEPVQKEALSSNVQDSMDFWLGVLAREADFNSLRSL